TAPDARRPGSARAGPGSNAAPDRQCAAGLLPVMPAFVQPERDAAIDRWIIAAAWGIEWLVDATDAVIQSVRRGSTAPLVFGRATYGFVEGASEPGDLARRRQGGDKRVPTNGQPAWQSVRHMDRGAGAGGGSARIAGGVPIVG